MQISFDEHARRVTLERGRALFRVAKNPDRPFLVRADGTTVRAVGTAFGIDRQRDGVVVTVAEGKVAVFATKSEDSQESRRTANAGEATGAAEAEGSPSTQLISPSSVRRAGSRAQLFLTAGQQVRMESSGTAEPVHKVDSDRELAWAKGRLVFESDSVQHVVEEFNRYNRIQLEVRDSELAKRPISGTFSAADPESFVAFLQTVVSIRVRQDDVGTTIIEAAK